MADSKVADTTTKAEKPLWQGRNVGKLKQMLNVPMDVFFEIVSHLEPKDVLQLSRTSIELRTMLRSPNSRHVWVTARRNVIPPPPDPPGDMSEPLYAFLVFERFCQKCGQGRAQNADYALRVRLCGDCWRNNTEKGKDLCRSLGLSRKKDVAEVLYTLTPRGTRTWSDGNWDKPLLALDQSANHWYYILQFMPVAKQYLALCKPSSDSTALQRFVEERQAETLARRNFHRAMLRWESARNNARYHTGADAQAERISEIYDKLCELGYERSEFPRYNHDWNQMLEQPRKLTTRIWNTIRPNLVAILDQQREVRDAEAFRVKWAKRREQLQALYKTFLQQDRTSVEMRTLPNAADALEFACMKQLVTAEEPDVDLTEDRFLAIRATMLSEAQECCARIKHELATKLAAIHNPRPVSPESSAPPRKRRRVAGATLVAKGKQVETLHADMDSEEEHKLLENPNSIFRCSPRWHRTDISSSCNIYMSYLGLLEHLQVDHASSTWHVRDVYVAKPGNYHDLDTEFAERLLTALGLGKDATHSELDELLRSGRPRCSCGQNSGIESKPRWQILGRLIQHLELPLQRSQPNYTQAAELGAGLQHHITLEPYEARNADTTAHSGEVSNVTGAAGRS